MSIATVIPAPIPQWFDNSGIPLAGGFLYAYEAGTSTPQNMYTDSALTVPYSNPIVLDSSGRPAGPIYLLTSPAYKFILQDANAVQIWEADAIIASAPSA